MKFNWNTLVYIFMLGMALDLCLAFAAAHLLTSAPSQYFWLYAAVIIVAPAMFGLWGLAKRWAHYFVFGREALVRIFLKEFHTHRFPSPVGEYDIDQYLLNVTNDASIPESTKIAAGVIAGQIASAKNLSGFSTGLMMTFSAERAMQRYVSSPAPQPLDSDELLTEDFWKSERDDG